LRGGLAAVCRARQRPRRHVLRLDVEAQSCSELQLGRLGGAYGELECPRQGDRQLACGSQVDVVEQYRLVPAHRVQRDSLGTHAPYDLAPFAEASARDLNLDPVAHDELARDCNGATSVGDAKQAGDRGRSRGAEYLVPRARLEHTAAVEDDDLVGQQRGLLGVMRDDQGA
jgi:hypothetical protein